MEGEEIFPRKDNLTKRWRKLTNVKYVFMLFPVKKGLVMKNIVFLVSYRFDG